MGLDKFYKQVEDYERKVSSILDNEKHKFASVLLWVIVPCIGGILFIVYMIFPQWFIAIGRILSF